MRAFQETLSTPLHRPRKKILTEDSMAAHLSNMHISSSSAGNVEGDGDSGMSDSPIESLQNYSVNMSEWDFERKLRTAQKITISKEILELDKDGPNLLPEILLNRIARPCSALVLWKPAPTIGSLIADKNGDNLEGNEHDSNTTTKEELAAGVDEMETWWGQKYKIHLKLTIRRRDTRFPWETDGERTRYPTQLRI